MKTASTRSVRRLQASRIDPLNYFVWLTAIPFACLWFAYGIVEFSNAALDWLFS